MALRATLRRLLPVRLFGTGPSPADYRVWLARGPSLGGAFPEDWATWRGSTVRSAAQVAALVHVFHAELLPELLGHLASIPVPFDLIVTNATGIDLSVDIDQLPTVERCLILRVENRGRDLWPLVQVINAGLIEPHELVIKVHTKRSHWREGHRQLAGTGASWRAQLLSALLGDQANTRQILAAFRGDPHLGMVTADGSVLGPAFWGRNERATATLLERLYLELRPDALRFPAGSMYWTRGRLLRRLRDLRMTIDDFEAEAGQVDGTTAHALERVIGLLASDAGLTIAERSSLSQGPGTVEWLAET